jgi:TetR/AcrR family transcriptional repressor of nem operon
MARPREFDTEEAEQALLDAFWRKGFASTSLQDLSEATGLQAGSLYAAFGSKDAMFRVALARYQRWLGREVTPKRGGLDGIKYVLDTVVRLTLADAERRGCPLINATAETATLSVEAKREIDAGLMRMRALFRRLIADAGASVAARDADATASLLLAASVSIRVLGRAGAGDEVLRQVAYGAMAAVRALLATKRKAVK